MFNCNSPCCQNGASGGFLAVTFSGTLSGRHPKKGFQGNSVCTLNNPSNIFHIVIVETLLTYPIDVTCSSTIITSPSRTVKFYSPVPTDTDIRWDSIYPLPGRTTRSGPPIEHPFDHVQLLQTTGHGQNDLDIDVTAKAAHRPTYKLQQPIRISVTV
jgi:hypothetical protein